MGKTPCPQRAPNQSTFLWFHMGVVKLNNEWGLASWAGLLGVRFGIPSCFDVWRQPPIMESIIARCSLLRPLQPFQSTLALAASGFRPLSALFIFPLFHFLSLALSLPLPFLSLRYECEGKDLFRIGRNYTDRITEDRFRGRSAESGLRTTRVHKDTAITVP